MATINETRAVAEMPKSVSTIVEPTRPASNSLLESLKIKIDPEFKSLMHSISEVEHNGLKEDILKNGCRDALVVWKGQNILLDGHHRLAICQEINAERSEKSITPKIVAIDLPDKISAKIWIIKNQISRRNLNESQRSMLAAPLADLYAEQAKGRQGARTDLDPKLDRREFGRSLEKAAKDMNVSHQSVADARKVISSGIPELKQLVDNRGLAVSAAAKVAKTVAKQSPEIQSAFHNEIIKIASERSNASEARYRATLKEINEILQRLSPSGPRPDENIVIVERKLNGIKDSLDSFETTAQPEKINELIALGKAILTRLKAILAKSSAPAQTGGNKPGEHQLEIDPESLKTLLASVIPVENGLKLRFYEDRIEIAEVSPDGSRRSGSLLLKECFDKYEMGACEICLKDTKEILEFLSNREGEKVQIFIEPKSTDTQDRMMYLRSIGSNGNTKDCKVQLMQPESIRKEVAEQALDFACEATLSVSGKVFADQLGRFEETARISIENSDLKIEDPDGDIDPVIIPCEVSGDGPTGSEFDLSRLLHRNVLETIARSDTISLELGEDFPLAINLEIGKIIVRYELAPLDSGSPRQEATTVSEEDRPEYQHDVSVYCEDADAMDSETNPEMQMMACEEVDQAA